MPKTCPQCQSEAADTATFCPSCGASLASGTGASAPPPPAGAPSGGTAPGAGTGSGQGGYGEDINPSGEIAGESIDATGVYHGFLRFPDGSMSVFDALGAGTAPAQGTLVAGVSGLTSAGEVIGYYIDNTSVAHGYVRAPDGTITTFDAPGAGTGPGQGTYVGSINPKGRVTCFYVDASGVYHGVVRVPDGTITSFDAPGAGTGPGQGTVPQQNMQTGEIVGYYVDANNVNHGFLRSKNGTFTTFDAPGAGTYPGQGTLAVGIA